MKNNYDIVVVGGGPAGSTFAYHTAMGGLSVLVLEKDRDIGMPVRCGEAVSDTGLRIFHEPRSRWIRSTVDRIRMVAPDNTEIEFDMLEKGYILDRRVFDYDLAHLAAEQGAEIVTKAYVSGLIIEDDIVCGVTGDYLNEPFSIRAKLVIGADGVESRIGRWAGIRTQLKMKDIESAVQKTIGGIDLQENMFEFYLARNRAPGGYVWVFPKGPHSANVGLGISGTYAMDGKSAQAFLDEFIEERFPGCSVLTTVAGGVPVAKTLKKITSDGIMLIGDAARMVNPTTGGGIIAAMRSGQLAGETALDVIKNNQAPLQSNLKSYVRNWHKIGGKRHEQFYRIKEAIYNFSDHDLNRVAAGIAKVPEADRSLLKLFSVALRKKPSLLIDVARVFAGV